ncbi:argonaute complex, subunit Arb1 [Rhizophagus irregularis DAOM 181602=DAOM 197198]|nr:argonaute complex, subunit Arb1 [Rhizophagus irregularis DAOM 181602=DAOM 197198]
MFCKSVTKNLWFRIPDASQRHSWHLECCVMNSWLGSLLLWFKSDPEKRLPLDHVTTHPWILKNNVRRAGLGSELESNINLPGAGSSRILSNLTSWLSFVATIPHFDLDAELLQFPYLQMQKLKKKIISPEQSQQEAFTIALTKESNDIGKNTSKVNVENKRESQDGLDNADADAEEIAARRATEYIDDEADDLEVCPEYEEDMQTALQIAHKAKEELPNCKALAQNAPGKLNKATALTCEIIGVEPFQKDISEVSADETFQNSNELHNTQETDLYILHYGVLKRPKANK